MKLSKEEKEILIELICNKQTYMIFKNQYDTDKYNLLEALKTKLR